MDAGSRELALAALWLVLALPGSGSGPMTLAAAETTPASASETPGRPPLFHLRNATRISGEPRHEFLHVETRYGVLRVPVRELVLVRFARRLDPSQRELAESAVSDLAADDFDRREEAMATLRALGPAVVQLLRAARRSEDEEVALRAQTLLEELRAGSSPDGDEEDALSPIVGSEDDEVVTQRFTMRGRVREESFTIDSRYGVLEVARADVVGIVYQQEQEMSARLQVPSANVAPHAWLKTKVVLQRSSKIAIKASGTLQQENYGISVGPEGTSRHGTSSFQGFPMLALVGKVGKRGKPFLVGRQYKGKPGGEGPLYLAVVPFRRNYQASGNYDVKVRTAP